MDTRLTGKRHGASQDHTGDVQKACADMSGEPNLQPAGARFTGTDDPFDAVRGTAQIPWRTDELMRCLRSDD